VKKGYGEKMIKGKSTIELFDGITGKKKEEYKDENIVTNAIRNLFDWNGEMLAMGISVDGMLERLTPLYPHYLRGILLWDNIIAENPDNILPPPGINCVGHAGGFYGGANPLRGTWNENETEIKENGVKMVWDFHTDKANSTIKSISLTSIAGGNRGWMTPWEAGTFFRQRINNGSSSQSTINFAPTTTWTQTLGTGSASLYAGELRRGIHTYVADRNDNSLTIIEHSHANPSALSILDSAGVVTAASPHCREEVFSVASDARFSNLSSNYIIDGDKNLVHVSLSGTGNRTARIRTVNLITKTLTGDRTITLSNDVGASSVAYFKNRLYAGTSGTGGGICEFNSSGSFVRRILNFTSNSRYHCFGGEYIASPVNVSNGGLFISDGINTVVTQVGSDNAHPAVLFNAASLKPPLLTMVYEATSTHHTRYIGFITPYMATINNLAAPVIKDELNTMKITYELTQE